MGVVGTVKGRLLDGREGWNGGIGWKAAVFLPIPPILPDA